MSIKIINSLLILFIVSMGLKQGYAMLSGKAAMLSLFAKWNFGKTAVAIYGAVTILSACLILFPKIFVWGNFMMATTILLLICLHLQDKNLKEAAIEIPFLLLNLLAIYLQYPFTRTS